MSIRALWFLTENIWYAGELHPTDVTEGHGFTVGDVQLYKGLLAGKLYVLVQVRKGSDVG